MKTILIATAVVAVVALQGCASVDRAFGGGASYEYSHTTTANGDTTCEVSVTSAREVTGGSITILDDCTMESGAQSLTGLEATMQTFGKLIDKIPGQ